VRLRRRRLKGSSLACRRGRGLFFFVAGGAFLLWFAWGGAGVRVCLLGASGLVWFGLVWFGFGLVWFGFGLVLFACVCAGIRDLLSGFRRRPCAGRHLLFFAAAKKSRQKKAAHTASPCSYPRAPNIPILHTATSWLVPVANASNECLTRFKHPYNGRRQRMVCAAQVANCV
jgi:hypothetical protein